MNYDKEYFIKKFEAIPENEIGQGTLSEHCALWHCGVKGPNWRDNNLTDEAKALADLLMPKFGVDAPDNQNGRCWGGSSVVR